MKKLVLYLFLVFAAVTAAKAQISVINQKGTRVTLDSSKWQLSGVNIFNKNTGNVGLGNASPTYKLDVTGKARITDSLVANTGRVLTLGSGTTNDSLVVADPATGILKRISTVRLNHTDSTTASNGLNLSGKDIKLGGTLSSATSINTSAGNTLALSGLQSGALTDSVVVADPSTGVLKRIATTKLNHADSTTASNGITLSAKDIKLGGALTGATSITTTATNTLALSGLQSGAVTDSMVVADPSTGVLKRITSARLNRADSTTASNGITMSGKDIKLGGSLSGATSITTTAANTLALSGLQAGAATDSLVSIDPSTGVLKKISGTRLNRADSTTASNGLSLSGTDVKLGGTLSAATAITTSAGNTLALSGLQSGAVTDSMVVADPSTGVLKRITSARLNRADSTTASNGITMSGKDIKLGGSLSGATSIATTATNTLALSGLQAGAATDSLVSIDPSSGVLKKISGARLNRADSTTASNGLTLSGTDVKLGGTLSAATAITTSAGNTLALSGLQSGAVTDSMIVVDPSTGVLKRITSARLNRADSTTASNGITLSGKDIKLGGSLSGATSIATTATNTLALSGLQAGAATDSLVSIDPSTGVLKKISGTRLNRADSTTASNGLSLSGTDVKLGGTLSAATAITTSAGNTLALSGLQSGTATDSLVSIDPSTGVLKRITGARLNRADSTTASNGITLSGKDIKLGGSLSGATSIATTATNTLALSGLQAGATTDSLVSIDPSTGILKKISSTRLNRADSTTASNGLSLSGTDVKLGGTLSAATAITTSAGNTLALSGLQNGTATDSLVSIDPSTGVLKRISGARLNRADSTTASNGITLSGKDIKLGGSLSGATSITTTASNTLALSGLQNGAATDSLVSIDPSTGVLKRITSSRFSRADSTTASNGITLSGKDIKLGGSLSSATSITTTATNTLALSGLQNGTATDSLVSIDPSTSVLKRISSARFSRADSTTASNGITLSGKDIKLGGSLSGATSITTTAANTLALAGLQSGFVTDSLVVIDPSSGVLRRISAAPLHALDNISISNGLNFSGTDLKLGGALTAATTITATATNTLALDGLQSGFTTDSLVVVDPSSGVLRRVSAAPLHALDNITISNGLSFSGTDVKLGGPLTGATTITTSASNTLAFAGLQSGAVTDSVLVSNPATGIIKRMSAARLNREDSTTASNGLTISGLDVRLGGSLTAATTLTTSASNTLALAGLQSGAVTDSVLVSNPVTGVVKRMSAARLNREDSTTASNGLTLSGLNVKLGGSLTGATAIGTSASNTLALTGLQSGDTGDSLVVADASTGILKRINANFNKSVVIKTTSTQSTSSTTPVTISTLSFSAQAGKHYRIWLWLIYNSNSTGNGIRVGPKAFTGSGDYWYTINVVTATSGTNQTLTGFNTSTSDSYLSSNNSRATTGNVATITMDLECSSSGTVSFQFGSESSSGSNSITIQPDSRLSYDITN